MLYSCFEGDWSPSLSCEFCSKALTFLVIGPPNALKVEWFVDCVRSSVHWDLDAWYSIPDTFQPIFPWATSSLQSHSRDSPLIWPDIALALHIFSTLTRISFFLPIVCFWFQWFCCFGSGFTLKVSKPASIYFGLLPSTFADAFSALRTLHWLISFLWSIALTCHPTLWFWLIDWLRQCWFYRIFPLEMWVSLWHRHTSFCSWPCLH